MPFHHSSAPYTFRPPKSIHLVLYITNTYLQKSSTKQRHPIPIDIASQHRHRPRKRLREPFQTLVCLVNRTDYLLHVYEQNVNPEDFHNKDLE